MRPRSIPRRIAHRSAYQPVSKGRTYSDLEGAAGLASATPEESSWASCVQPGGFLIRKGEGLVEGVKTIAGISS